MSDTAKMTYFESNRPVQSFLSAARALITRPRAFFTGMPVAAFYANSLFFASIVIFALSFLSVPFYGMVMLFMLPVTWGTVLIGMWGLGVYISWAVSTFTAFRLSPANAFQLSAYAFLPMMLSSLSWLGIAALAWSIYLLWTGLVANGRISGVAAMAIIAFPVLCIFLIGGGMMLAMSQVRIHA